MADAQEQQRTREEVIKLFRRSAWYINAQGIIAVQKRGATIYPLLGIINQEGVVDINYLDGSPSRAVWCDTLRDYCNANEIPYKENIENSRLEQLKRSVQTLTEVVQRLEQLQR